MSDREPPDLLNVKQLAAYLQLNEKKVYTLAGEGKLPATKITGKWLFPRHLIDQWILETSHGGVLRDRLIVAGSDDPLLQHVVARLAIDMQDAALVSYTCTGTQLGLSLLARHRADVCALHWGPASESHLRHPALLRHHPQHHRWVLVRLMQREQGLILARALTSDDASLAQLPLTRWRWAMRQDGSGSQRFLQELLTTRGVQLAELTTSLVTLSEREAGSAVARGLADVAPGVRAGAGELGLGFIATGWEAFDLALHRDVYFRTLFRKFMKRLEDDETQAFAAALGGYDFGQLGQLVWAE